MLGIALLLAVSQGQAAPATMLVITSGPVTTTAGQASSAITVERQDKRGRPNNSGAALTLTMSSMSSGTVTFNPPSPQIAPGTSSVTFTYTDTEAGTPTITAHSGSLTDATQQETVNAGTASQLQVLMPGESAAPGTSSGKTGSPTTQTVGAAFNVTVNAVDAYWNLVNTVVHTVAITSSDTHATLPSNAALSGGTKTFGVTFNSASASGWTVTATDQNGSPLTANTGAATPVNKATPVLQVNNSPVTYNGSAQAASVSAGSVGGTVSNVRYGGSSTVPTAAGTYAITADFAPTDSADYNSLTGASAGNFVIQKATPTLSVVNSPVTYNGSAQAATVNGSVGGTVSNVKYNGSGTVPISAGTYAITADFAPTDSTDYNSVSAGSAGNLVILTALSGATDSAGLPLYTAGTIPVTFVAKDSVGTILGTAEQVVVNTANGGQSFTFTIGVPSGTKTVSLKPRFWLRKKFDLGSAVGTENTRTLNMSGYAFVGGDANSDNQVDGNDYAWIRELWGATSNTQYDINGDGKIDANDLPDLNGDGTINAQDYRGVLTCSETGFQ